jgi:cell division protein FtsB
VGIVVFYVLLVLLLPCLYEAALYFTLETRVEGQVIPPPGMLLANEVWIVTDFRDLATGIADDLASDRQIVVQDMQEKLGHVQRAQADVATREARIRLLKDQIQSDNDEEMSLMKQARNASQQVWDGPGAQIEADYQSRLTELNQAIDQRAKANHLAYSPDPTYYSPEVWANAYRLALYQVPAGVDAVRERTWLDGQMKAWHDFTKAMDLKETNLRQQAAQLRLQPNARVTDLKGQVADLQQRIDATLAEEEPLKAELDQARADLAAVQAKEAGLDAKPYAMLDALPEKNVTKRLELQRNGRFSWREVEKENKYAADEKAHVFWIFARAYRSDGRQYWALNRFSVAKDSTTLLIIEPDSFISTKSILRPDLSPDEQAR